MSEYTFQFAVLRYIHDPVTQEFLNIGVVIYSKEARYIKPLINSKYGRLSKTFRGVNGEYYRHVTDHIARQLIALHERYHSQLDLFDELPPQIELILNPILPPDDSSLIFGGYGGGLTRNLDDELRRLYERLVIKYAEEDKLESRNDQQIWQVYSHEFDKRHITLHLSPATIKTPTYYYEFDHAWKNDRWHPLEPISFDLIQERSIMEKANRWIGRALTLADSEDIGKLYMLLGSPTRRDLRAIYQNAVANMRSKLSGSKLEFEIIEEEEAANFSEKLAKLIKDHGEDIEFSD